VTEAADETKRRSQEQPSGSAAQHPGAGGKRLPEIDIPELGRTVEQTGRPITHAETMQQVIVYFVLGLLAVTLVAVIFKWVRNPLIDMQAYTSSILAPVLALTGPILGFYFTRSAK
jgi:hypothetical protein